MGAIADGVRELVDVVGGELDQSARAQIASNLGGVAFLVAEAWHLVPPASIERAKPIAMRVAGLIATELMPMVGKGAAYVVDELGRAVPLLVAVAQKLAAEAAPPAAPPAQLEAPPKGGDGG